MGKRDRGHLLTDTGLSRLEEAITQWQEEQERKCTQAIIQELSGGLDPKTISKIRKRKAGTDVDSIQRFFGAFGLQLEYSDHYVPLEPGTKTESERNFVGREKAIADLNHLASQNHRIIVIQAKGGVGKTTLAQQYLKTQGFDKVLELWMAKETLNIASVEGVIEEWLRRDFEEEPGREFGVTLERLRQKLRDPALRIGVLIDNLEPALDSAGKFVAEHRRYVELLRVLGDGEAHSLTLVTSRERLRESAVSIQPYLLSSLDREAWQLRFEARQVQMDEAALTEIHRAYGGNAKAMEILCSAILQDYQGELAAYWEANQDDLLMERDLEDLVVGQFERLREQDPDAYKLLCRMGCYRYQDVPTVPLEGLLCLLWDVPEREQKRVVRRLQERALMEWNDEFWLHPVVKSKAIELLRQETIDFNKTHELAAKRWIKSTPLIRNSQDAINIFQAYYHFTASNNFYRAGLLIVNPIEYEKEKKIHRLGSLFIRLGLWQVVLKEVRKVIEKTEREDLLANLAGIFANANLLTGDIHTSLTYHQISKNAAESLTQKTQPFLRERDISFLHYISLINMAICNVYLWELEIANRYVLECYQQYNLVHRVKLLQEESLLAFTFFYLGDLEKSQEMAELAYSSLGSSKDDLDMWSLGYGGLFLGWTYAKLGNMDQAREVYKTVLEAVNQTESFHHLEGVCLTREAEIDRKKGDLLVSLRNLKQAEQKIRRFGNKCDLGENCYQRGLTYQAMDEHDQASHSFNQAINLFEHMNAPKQIARVRRSWYSD